MVDYQKKRKEKEKKRNFNNRVGSLIGGGGYKFGHFLAWIPDSRHVRQTNTVLNEESDFQVKNKQFLRPDEKNKESRISKILSFD